MALVGKKVLALNSLTPDQQGIWSATLSFTIRRNDLEQGVRARFHVAMHHNIALLAQDADAHTAGMEIDATVKLVRFGVESPEVSSSLASGYLPVPAYHGGMLRRGPQ